MSLRALPRTTPRTRASNGRTAARRPPAPTALPLQGRRIILGSHRPPFVRRDSGKWERSPGGLVTALAPTMHQLGGTWVAAGDVKHDETTKVPHEETYRMRLVPLSAADEEGYYLGYSNRVLWPTCHLRLDHVQFRQGHWEAYQRVNERFAQTVADEANAAPSAVWIHDYQLALVPRMLRARLRRATPISFFWHVPWPSHHVLRANPTRRELLEGLLGADVLGFQTQGFVQNFLAGCREELGDEAEVDGHSVRYDGHLTRAFHFPIGVDYASLRAQAESPEVAAAAQAIRRAHAPRPGMKIGLGVDRLDYSKGIVRRLQAIEVLFDRYPKYRRNFTFIQISNPTRSRIPAYLEYRSEVLSRVEDINARIGEDGWTPVQLVSARQSVEQLYAHYRAADALLVTSIADGMNLVAKEFVACQIEDRGALLLSELAGASEDLSEAILINPFDIDGMAHALHSALSAPAAYKRQRLRLMRRRVEGYSIEHWIQENLQAMESCLEADAASA